MLLITWAMRGRTRPERHCDNRMIDFDAFMRVPAGRGARREIPTRDAHIGVVLLHGRHGGLVAFERHVPVIGFDPEFVRKGALMSFWIDSADVGRGAAHLAHTILAGSPVPSSKTFLPKHRMALNQGTADYLGITIPPSVLSLADEVR